MIFVVDKNIVLLTQRGQPRSKYYDLWCSCTRKRKDRTCKHLDVVRDHRIRPEARHRVGVA